MTGSITFTGGTSAQQDVITEAHALLATAVATASTKAQSGDGGFSTWFGQSRSSPQSTVAGVFTTVAQNLANVDFAYDLTRHLFISSEFAPPPRTTMPHSRCRASRDKPAPISGNRASIRGCGTGWRPAIRAGRPSSRA